MSETPPSDRSPLLRVSGLSKRYPSFKLSSVSFSVRRGSIVGLVGRNGAGKTTVLKCIIGSTRKDAGKIEFFNHPLDGNESAIKQITGIVLGGALYYETKRLSAIADVYRRFYEMWDEDVYRSLIERFSLDGNKRVRELSQGMRVKFAIALALSHNAKLLILDEPTSGLDPLSRDDLLDLFLDLAANRQCGILFSTHITSDLDKCANEIVHIKNGMVEAACPLDEYRARYRIASADEARKANAEVLGVRRTSRGDTALVPASAGIGLEADLEEIMTHIDREEAR